ncbi:MAG: T9SS type A sorting domain-containing protein [Bacteroidales bacterium]|nr:T9SS type A sorting domain-containing protein [Bacteroidales bacterium]
MKKIAIVFVAVLYCLLPNVTKAQRTCTDQELSFTITHPDVLCQNATAIATVNIEVGGAGNTDVFWYEWSDGSTTQSIQISEVGMYYVTVTDTYNSCSKSDSIEIVQSPYTLPDISVHQCGSTGNQVTVCGTSVELCAEISGGGISDYTWLCNDIEGSFDDQTSSNPTFMLSPDVQISRYRDADFLFTVTNEDCSVTDTMHVRFLQRPVANAGIDHATCGNTYELNGVWSLEPADDYSPQGRWWVDESSMPDPSAQVRWLTGEQDSVVENVQVSDWGIYTFIFRETNSMGQANTCNNQDTVRVEFMEIPNANAGHDTIFCGLDFQLNAVSSQDENNNISGTWTSMSGGAASFDDSTDPYTTGHYSAYGAATFRWTETNHPSIETDDAETCSAFDEVVVTFYEPPTAVISMNEADTVVCGLVTPFFLRAEEPGDDISGYWYDANTSTQFGENNQTVNSIFTDARVASYGRHDFYWIEHNGPSDNPHLCTDTAGPWTINFIQTAEILEDQFNFCTSDGQLSAVPTETGEGYWSASVPDVITFDEPNNPNTAVHATILNNENSPYTIYWTVLDGSCLTKDSINVTFGDVPKHFIDTTVSNFVTIGDHTFYSTGNYTFSMPSETGCDTIYDLQLRVLAEPVYDIAPNPTSKMLNINSDGFISCVEIYSPTGQLIMHKEVNSNFAECDVESLVSGIYIVRIYGRESNLPSVYKIVKN